MNLTHVKICRFRSINETDISECGRLNVLIGKNNAGKSNLLSAIHGFFAIANDRSFITLRPMFASELDYFNQDVSTPIEITCCFLLSSGEMGQLILSIGNDYPHVANVITSLADSRFLKATVKYFHRPSPFGLITQITFNSSKEMPHDGTDRFVYRVEDNVAPQLHQNASQASMKKQQQTDFTRVQNTITEEYYSFIRRQIYGGTPRPGGTSFRAILDARWPGTLRNETSDAAEADFQATDNYAEFQAALRQRIAAITSDITKIENTPISGDVLTVGGQEHIVPAYVTDIVKRFAEVKVLYQRDMREPIGLPDAQRLLSLRVQKGGDRLFRTFQETATALVGVELDAFEEISSPLPESQDEYYPRWTRPSGERRARLDVDNFLVQANGSGIREALRLLIDIELEKPSIMLIEEPEIHLHPALETSMRRYLKSRSETSQIFLTTHSTNFVDSGEYSSMFFIKKNGATNATLLTSEELADVLPQELGLKPSSLFMFDKLLFVEGPSDEDVLREWSATLQKNLSQAGVGFILLGGARNIRHFAAERTTAFLGKRGVDLWFILDRDEKASTDVEKLQKQVGPHCKIRSLPVREIENYLLSPDAIARYLALRLSRDITAAQIGEIIKKSVESLRDFALAKTVFSRISAPAYITVNLEPTQAFERQYCEFKKSLQQESAEIASRVQIMETSLPELKAEFDQNWEADKLRMAPGVELLNAVFAEYGMSYRKMRDAEVSRRR